MKRAWRDAKEDHDVELAAARRRAVARKVGWSLFWAAAFLGVLGKLVY